MTNRVLVFDFGGPVLKTPFELLDGTRARLGLAHDTLQWFGPFAPERDEVYRRWQGGDISERDYWVIRAAEFSELTGKVVDTKAMMTEFYTLPAENLVRPESVRLIADAKRAGIPVGMLTNDLEAFHPQEWRDAVSVIKEFDAKVDGSIDGVMKPDPRAYALICERMGIEPSQAVYIDDQPANVAGGEAAGMISLYFDPTKPTEAIAQARALVGLPEVQ